MSAIGVVSAQSQSTTVPQVRLVQAAHEFEAQLMKELLKPMMSGFSADGTDEEQGSGGPMAGFATEALGQALSRQGGLGIATSLLHTLSRNEENAEPASNPGTKDAIFQNAGAFRLK